MAIKLYDYLDDLFDQLRRRKLMKLAISLPPRHGKTESVIRCVANWMQAELDHRVMVSSYHGTLTAELVRAIDQLVHRKPLGVPAFGAACGFGADLVVLEDLIKNKEQAESEQFLEELWAWVESVALCRMTAGARIAVIGSRRSAHDPIGRILAGDAGDDWTVINLPAVALQNDPLGRRFGEPLDSDGYDGRALLSIRRLVGAVDWATLYQGHPPDDGLPRLKRGGLVSHGPVRFIS